MGGRRRFLTAREQHEMLSPWRSGLSRMAGSHTYDDDEASTPGPGKWRFHNGVTGESFHLYGPSENEAWKKYLDIVGCDCHANPEDHEYGEDEENPLENTYVDQWDDPKSQYTHLKQLTDPNLFRETIGGDYDPDTDPFDPRIFGASRKHAEQAKNLEWQRDSSGNWILVTRNPDGNPVAVTTKPAPNVRTSRRGDQHE